MPLAVLEDGDPELSMSGSEDLLGALAPFPGSCPAWSCQAGPALVMWLTDVQLAPEATAAGGHLQYSASGRCRQASSQPSNRP